MKKLEKYAVISITIGTILLIPLAITRTLKGVASPLSPLDILLGTGTIICVIITTCLMDISTEKRRRRNNDLSKM